MSYPDEKFKQVLESLINPLVDSFKSAFESCEKIISRVKSVSKESTDEEYPTAKAVYTLGEEIKKETSETYEKISNRDTVIDSDSTDEKYPTTKATYNAFQKAIYTAVEQAGSITVDGVDIATASPNLFNKNAQSVSASDITSPSEASGIITGASLSNTDGTLYLNPLRFITPYIPIDIGESYTTVFDTATYGTTNRVHYYDENYIWLGVGYIYDLESKQEAVAATFVAGENTTIDTSKIAYCRLNSMISQLETYMIVAGDSYPESFFEYGISLKENVKIPQLEECLKIGDVECKYDSKSTKPLSGTAVAEIVEPLIEIASLNKGGNLFNKNAEKKNASALETPSDFDGIILGASISNETNTFYENQYRFITPFIPVQYGEKYTVIHHSLFYGTTARMHLYDADKNWLGVTYAYATEEKAEATPVTFTVSNQDAVYCKLCYATGLIDTFMVVKGDALPMEYLQYGEDTYSIADSKVDSPLKGKIISFNGDSICAGAGASGGYGKIIASRCGMVYENIGVSGGTVMYSGEDGHCISRTVVDMREDADYIILEGGVNDLYSNRVLGVMSDGYNSELDDTTFYGAFENMLKQALIHFPGKKIGYIAVHKMTDYFNSEVTENSAYYAALECCKKWGIPVCNLNISCPPFVYLKNNPETAFMADLYTADTDGSGKGDGWHPNEEGYLKYYCDPIEKWLETL